MLWLLVASFVRSWLVGPSLYYFFFLLLFPLTFSRDAAFYGLDYRQAKAWHGIMAWLGFAEV